MKECCFLSEINIQRSHTNEKIVYLKGNENSKPIIFKTTSCYENENDEHRRI